MEIEFNANNVGKPGAVKPVVRQEPVLRVEENKLFQTDTLAIKLNEIPLVRPEKVEEAKVLVSGVMYPPDDVLRSLATLLALKLSN